MRLYFGPVVATLRGDPSDELSALIEQARARAERDIATRQGVAVRLARIAVEEVRRDLRLASCGGSRALQRHYEDIDAAAVRVRDGFAVLHFGAAALRWFRAVNG